MKPPLLRHIVPVLVMLVSAAGCRSQPISPEASAKPVASAASVKDDRALAILKGMSGVIANAHTMTFRADSVVATDSPSGQWIHLFGASQVTAQRPDKLYVETRGDMFPQNFYYDGKTVTMYAPNEKLYASETISGKLDQTLLQVLQKHGTSFSFADVLQSIPHEAMAKDVTRAQFVGQSTVGGVLTNHLAFAGPGIEWEIWIGNDDQLPRLLMVTYVDVKDRPACSVAFADWQLNPSIPEETFEFTPPPGSARIEYRKLDTPEPK